MDLKELNERIDKSKMSKAAIAKECGFARETLYNKLDSGNFSVAEATKLAEILHLNNEEKIKIFL